MESWGDLKQWENQREGSCSRQGARKMKNTCPVITPSKLHTWQHEPWKGPGLVPSSVPCPRSLSGRPFPFRGSGACRVPLRSTWDHYTPGGLAAMLVKSVGSPSPCVSHQSGGLFSKAKSGRKKCSHLGPGEPCFPLSCSDHSGEKGTAGVCFFFRVAPSRFPLPG